MKLVVSLWRENPDWILNVPDHWDITIYVKDWRWNLEYIGRLRTLGEVIILPNVGRESHTWLYHMINNYDSLDDLTLFVQGHPFDHCPHMMRVLFCRNLLEIKKLAMTQWEHNRYVSRADLGYVGLGISWPVHLHSHTRTKWEKKECEKIPMVWRTAFGDSKLPEVFNAVYGAQFAISREMIRSLPLDLYQRLMNLHDGSKDNYIVPWVLEKIMPEMYLH